MSDSKTKIEGNDRLYMAGLIHNLLMFARKFEAIQSLRHDTVAGMGEISDEETIRLLLPLIDNLQIKGSASFLLLLLTGDHRVEETIENRRYCYNEVDTILNGGGATTLDPECVYIFHY